MKFALFHRGSRSLAGLRLRSESVIIFKIAAFVMQRRKQSVADVTDDLTAPRIVLGQTDVCMVLFYSNTAD